jgi:two-component system chemotaxis response regulator CheB
MRERPLHVLVVDDSALVRQMLADILSGAGGMTVSTAADPLIAMSRMSQARPDVILLDLEMPRMDGLSFLRKIMAEDPIPVVVCSGAVGRGTDKALQAIDEGAVELVAKPRLGVRGFLEDSALMLAETVRAAAGARRPPSPPPPRHPGPAAGDPSRAIVQATPRRLGALGASTGGTEALRIILQAMPADGPPVVIVQHMPEAFTRAFAARLDRLCQMEVREARDGDRVAPGRALVAPGNRHLVVRGRPGRYEAGVVDGDPVSRHRPSVDVLFRSVAETAGPEAVGVILTGMGSDGSAGLLEMRRRGAFTIAQDEASAVVFGMPRNAIACGAAEGVLPLENIAATVLARAGGRDCGLPPRASAG